MNLISIRNATRARKQAEKSGVSLNSKARRSKISSRSAACVNFRKDFGDASRSQSPSTGLISHLPRPLSFSRFLANKFRTNGEIRLSRLSGGLFSHPKMQSNPTSETSSTSFRHEFNFRLHCLPTGRAHHQIPNFPSPVELHFARREIADDGLLNPRCK